MGGQKPGSSAVAPAPGADPISRTLTDEQFESKINEFSRKLENGLVGNLTVKNKSSKKRPNYDESWVRSLKSQLQQLEKQRTRGSTTNYSQSSTANSSYQSGAGAKAAR